MQTTHLGDRLVVRCPQLSQACIRYIRLAAKRYKERLLSQIGFLGRGIDIRTHVVVVIEERVVMVRQTGFRRVLVRFLSRQRTCASQIRGLELRRTQLDTAVCRYSGKQRIDYFATTAVHSRHFVSVVLRVVPLAPCTDDTGLEAEDNVCIRLPMRFVLRDMFFRVVPCSIIARRRIGVGKTDDGFHPFAAQHVHVFVKRIENSGRQFGSRAEMIQVVMHEDNRHALRGFLVVQRALIAFDGVRLGGREMAFKHGDESALRVREDRRVVCGVGDSSCLRHDTQ